MTNGRGQQATLAQQREDVIKTPLEDRDVNEVFQDEEEDVEWFMSITDSFRDLSSSCVVDRGKFYDPAHISPVTWVRLLLCCFEPCDKSQKWYSSTARAVIDCHKIFAYVAIGAVPGLHETLSQRRREKGAYFCLCHWEQLE